MSAALLRLTRCPYLCERVLGLTPFTFRITGNLFDLLETLPLKLDLSTHVRRLSAIFLRLRTCFIDAALRIAASGQFLRFLDLPYAGLGFHLLAFYRLLLSLLAVDELQTNGDDLTQFSLNRPPTGFDIGVNLLPDGRSL
ncbi:hypothetical protein [Methylobacterium sp. ARG-1]|uniref:hypothetical protein n=1 Tax=Methylobacterium sp. ARG-1 TaxID=1692501 RepID=UPI00067FDD80|nr:hypothetical protein [Methylobacterium sp. ARG-1]